MALPLLSAWAAQWFLSEGAARRHLTDSELTCDITEVLGDSDCLRAPRPNGSEQPACSLDSAKQ